MNQVYILIKNVGEYDEKWPFIVKVFENENDANNECIAKNEQARRCADLTNEYNKKFNEWHNNNPTPTYNDENYTAWSQEYEKVGSSLASSIGVDVLWKELDVNRWNADTVEYFVDCIPFVHEAR